MKCLYIICLLICIFGCNDEDSCNIEVYLTKNYIEPYEGVLFRETEQYSKLDSTYKEWYKNDRVDTINKKLIYGSSFKATVEDLNQEPFINDAEIRGFSSKQDLLILDTIVNQRIKELFPSKKYVQFVITVNRVPMLNGYFRNPMSSRLSTTYSIFPEPEYIYNRKVIDGNKIGYIIEYGNPKFMNTKDTRPPYNRKLIEAFKKSNRLVK